MFDPVLTDEEVAALRAMRERIRSTRPDSKGPQMTVHFAVEDALGALAAIGGGSPSSHKELEDAGKAVREAVLAR